MIDNKLIIRNLTVHERGEMPWLRAALLRTSTHTEEWVLGHYVFQATHCDAIRIYSGSTKVKNSVAQNS